MYPSQTCMFPNGHKHARFGVFEVDFVAREIRKHGTRIRIQEQPFNVLCALIEKPGELITREELRSRLWPDETFVDFDQSVNKAVNKLRAALGDSANHPIYIETLARRGYRFLTPVEAIEPAPPAAPVELPTEVPPASNRRRLLWAAGAIPLAILIAGLWPVDTPKVVDVVQLTHDGTDKLLLVADGVRVMYTDTAGLWSIPSSGGEPKPIPLPFLPPSRHFVILCGYSPTSQQILVRSGGTGQNGASELWLTGSEGENPRKVGEVASFQSRLVLSPDGSRIALGLPDGIYIQSIAGGGVKKILPMKWSAPGIIWWGPSGRSIGFLDGPGEDLRTRGWQATDDGSKLRRIVPEQDALQGPGRWSAGGDRFFYPALDPGHESTEIFVRVQGHLLGWLRKPSITKLTASGQSLGWLALDPVDPKRLYVAGRVPRAETMRFDRRSGKWVPFLSGFSGQQISRSADGQWLAYVSYPKSELHKCAIDGSGDVVLARGVFACNPLWSPDGKRIAFAGRRPGVDKDLNLWIVSASGGDAAVLHPEIDIGTDTIWSKDGNRILFSEQGGKSGKLPGGGSRIKILTLENGHTETIPNGEEMFSPRWSPDNTKVLAVGANGHLYLFNEVTKDWREMNNVLSAYPTWAADGRWVYAFDQSSNNVFRVEVATGRQENIARPDFKLANAAWAGWTEDWDPIMLRDLGSSQIFRIVLDR